MKVYVTSAENFDELYQELIEYIKRRYGAEYNHGDLYIGEDLVEPMEYWDDFELLELQTIESEDELRNWFVQHGWTLDRGWGGPNYKQKVADTTEWSQIWEYLEMLKDSRVSYDEVLDALLLTDVKINDTIIFWEDDYYQDLLKNDSLNEAIFTSKIEIPDEEMEKILDDSKNFWDFVEFNQEAHIVAGELGSDEMNDKTFRALMNAYLRDKNLKKLMRTWDAENNFAWNNYKRYRLNAEDIIVESTKTEATESVDSLVIDSFNHFLHDLGKNPSVSDILRDLQDNYVEFQGLSQKREASLYTTIVGILGSNNLLDQVIEESTKTEATEQKNFLVFIHDKGKYLNYIVYNKDAKKFQMNYADNKVDAETFTMEDAKTYVEFLAQKGIEAIIRDTNEKEVKQEATKTEDAQFTAKGEDTKVALGFNLSQKEAEMIQSVIGQSSDGMWENSTSKRNEAFWRLIVQPEAGDDMLAFKFFARGNNNQRFWADDLLRQGPVTRYIATKLQLILNEYIKDNGPQADLSDISYLGYNEKISAEDVKAFIKKLKAI